MHLGWYEDLAYRRLIDLYLTLGKPIKNDRNYILRATRAMEPEQQAAVDGVLAEFFVLRADGWHQTRCDLEIQFRNRISNNAKRAVREREIKRHKNIALPSTDDLPIIQEEVEVEVEVELEGTLRSVLELTKVGSEPSGLESVAPPAVIKIPLTGKAEFPITQTMIDEWANLYQSVDILQTLREIRGWNLANPTRRKTKSGILRHVNAWLAKEQNHG
jgi:uncharacterized protein YdaU (DUF1376 family)